ncbi:hypothetical protein UPYG_G00030540 [Umbra pygmaea]
MKSNCTIPVLLQTFPPFGSQTDVRKRVVYFDCPPSPSSSAGLRLRLESRPTQVFLPVSYQKKLSQITPPSKTSRLPCVLLTWVLNQKLVPSLSVWIHRFQELKNCGRCVETRMSSKMQSSNNIAHARRTVQQLRIEASIERIKVSKASADLMHYCGEHAKYDPLLMGIPASENPFKDKKPCTIL